MVFYDLHVHSAFSEGTSSIEQLASTAKILGYGGICFAEYYKGEEHIKKIGAELQRVKEKVGIEVFLGFEARNPKELNALADKRRKFDVLLAEGGSADFNREAVQTPEVDILTHPEFERYDSGLNHVMMKLAAKNQVAVEINFRQILINSKKSRSRILQSMRSNISLAEKFGAPVIICSGAVSHWEMRDPLSLASFASCLGMRLESATALISKAPERIVREAQNRKEPGWIGPGIKIVKR